MAPRPSGGRRHGHFEPEHLLRLLHWLRQRPDATLESLRKRVKRDDDPAMRCNDLAALTKLADQLRSSAGSHGFAPITAAAEEVALRAAPLQSVQLLIPQVEALVILCRSAVAVSKTRGVAGSSVST